MDRASERIARIRTISERASVLMSEHNVAPIPAHYEIWFAYASGEQPHLGRVIDAWIASKEPFSESLAADLRARFFEEPVTATNLTDIGDRLTAELEKLTSNLVQTGRDTSTYNQTLSGAAGVLGSSSDTKAVRTMIDNLLVATRHMERKSRELEAHLKASTEEVRSLRDDIESIRRQSLTDQLTGIANRKCFDERLRESIHEARTLKTPLCLLMGDIDHFKKFNDTWGHQTGDQVLRLVARALTESVKGRDTPARYGGEEFAVILPHTTLEDGANLAESIRKAVEAKKVIKRSTGETLGTITMSLGCAALLPGEAATALIDRADAALYEAKNSGRNCVRTRLESAHAAA